MFAQVSTIHADPAQLARSFTRLYMSTRGEKWAEEASKWRELVPETAWVERVKLPHYLQGMTTSR